MDASLRASLIIPLMTEDQLLAFIAIARHRSISRAAAELGIAQPTASDRLRALEDEVGARLTRRQGRGIALTPEGVSFLPYAQRALEVIQQGSLAVRAQKSGAAGHVSVAVTVTAGAYLFAPALVAFQSARPAVEVQVRSAHSADQLGLILDNVVHLALGSGPMVHPQVETLGVFHSPLALVAAPSHPVARQAGLEVAEFAKQRVLVSYWGPAYQQLLERIRTECEGRMGPWLELSPVALVKGMVTSGTGVSIVPEVSVRRELESGELVRLVLKGAELPRWQISLVRKRNRPKNPAADELAEVLLRMLPRLAEGNR